MRTSFCKLFVSTSIAAVLTSFVVVDLAEAQRRGGGAAAGARASGGRADVRTNDVRSTSVNNVNVQRNVNVDVEGCSGRCGGWDHPVAAAAVVAGTVAAIGTIVAAPPPNCVPVNYGGMVYQQCGGTWYAPQGPQYVVVNPPY
jgi:hypothetical protein